MTPDPLRPPPPAGPRPRPPRNWRFAMVLGLVIIGLPTALLLFRPRRDPWSGPEVTSEQFVHGLTLGSAPDSGPAPRTGFEAAYDVLSDQKKQAVPFDVFFEDWRRLTDGHGMIVDSVRTTEVRREDERSRRPLDLTYVLFLGGENQEHGGLEAVELKLSMTWNRKIQRFVVDDYVRKNVPNPRATR